MTRIARKPKIKSQNVARATFEGSALDEDTQKGEPNMKNYQADDPCFFTNGKSYPCGCCGFAEDLNGGQKTQSSGDDDDAKIKKRKKEWEKKREDSRGSWNQTIQKIEEIKALRNGMKPPSKPDSGF